MYVYIRKYKLRIEKEKCHKNVTLSVIFCNVM